MSFAETKCPMCGGVLWIDPSSLKIVDHRAADYKKPDLGEFLKEINKDKQWDEKLKKIKEEEDARKAALEEKFRQMKENNVGNNVNTNSDDTDEDAPKSHLDWD